MCAVTVKSEEAEWYCLDKMSLQPPQSMLDQPHTVFASNNPTATLSSRGGPAGSVQGAAGRARRRAARVYHLGLLSAIPEIETEGLTSCVYRLTSACTF